MNIGDLVKVTRGSIGVPKGTLGLIVNTRITLTNAVGASYFIHEVSLCGIKKRQGGNRQYLERDLEPVR